MASASYVYAGAEPTSLPGLTARALAIEPGQMCLVSLDSEAGQGLQPVAVSHAQPSAARHLQSTIAPRRRTPADAFSQTVVRTGQTLRMLITCPTQLRLWLPSAYWAYVEQAPVRGVLAAPLTAHNKAFGALLLWREGDEPAFEASDEVYLGALAARLSLGLAPR